MTAPRVAVLALCTVLIVGLNACTNTPTPTAPTGALNGPASANLVAGDTNPPIINGVTVSPAVLSPANHKMTTVTIAVDATDAEQGSVPAHCFVGKEDSSQPFGVTRLNSVESNEPVTSADDATSPDWNVPSEPDSLLVHVQLRAERAGSGSGRIYTVQLVCGDNAHNHAFTTVQVNVPHDRRK